MVWLRRLDKRSSLDNDILVVLLGCALNTDVRVGFHIDKLAQLSSVSHR